MIDRERLAMSYISAVCEELKDKWTLTVTIHDLVLALKVSEPTCRDVMRVLERQGYARKVGKGRWRLLLYKYRDRERERRDREIEGLKREIIMVLKALNGRYARDLLIECVRLESGYSKEEVEIALKKLIDEGVVRESDDGLYVELAERPSSG